jgi:hypothetical protein
MLAQQKKRECMFAKWGLWSKVKMLLQEGVG